MDKSNLSDSRYEYIGEGYSVRIQHCEYRDVEGFVCNEYLGVNYPSVYCLTHKFNQ